ncbi:hypothetical protein GCM10018987_64200 [Streptomyces cremeus]
MGGSVVESELSELVHRVERMANTDEAAVSGASGSSSASGASGAEVGYEQARDELIDVVRRLEAGGDVA